MDDQFDELLFLSVPAAERRVLDAKWQADKKLQMKAAIITTDDDDGDGDGDDASDGEGDAAKEGDDTNDNDDDKTDEHDNGDDNGRSGSDTKYSSEYSLDSDDHHDTKRNTNTITDITPTKRNKSSLINDSLTATAAPPSRYRLEMNRRDRLFALSHDCYQCALIDRQRAAIDEAKEAKRTRYQVRVRARVYQSVHWLRVPVVIAAFLVVVTMVLMARESMQVSCHWTNKQHVNIKCNLHSTSLLPSALLWTHGVDTSINATRDEHTGAYYTTWIIAAGTWLPPSLSRAYILVYLTSLCLLIGIIVLLAKTGCTARLIRRLELLSLNLPAVWPPSHQDSDDTIDEAKTTRAMRHATHIDDYLPFLLGIHLARRDGRRSKTAATSAKPVATTTGTAAAAAAAKQQRGVSPLTAFVNDPLFDDKLLTRLIGTFVDDSIAPVHT